MIGAFSRAKSISHLVGVNVDLKVKVSGRKKNGCFAWSGKKNTRPVLFRKSSYTATSKLELHRRPRYFRSTINPEPEY